MKAMESRYLEYLNKEMTIMGILSTFCVAVVALALDRVCGADKSTFFFRILSRASGYLWLGSASFSIAAALFYMQRSALAWFYGQIALSMDSPSTYATSTEDLDRDADSWATWTPYQSAFTAVAIGVVFYVVVVLRTSDIWTVPAWLTAALVIGSVSIQAVRMAIFRRHRYEDDPVGKVFPFLRRR
jgi:hypothetical protein